MVLILFSILYGFGFPAQGDLHETTVLRTNDIGKDLCYTIQKYCYTEKAIKTGVFETFHT